MVDEKRLRPLYYYYYGSLLDVCIDINLIF